MGLCALDYTCVVDRYPGPDMKIEAKQFSRQGGGPVPNALSALSHFGAKTSFIGKVGNDPEGKIVRSELERFGVDTSGLVMDSYSRTPRAFIWVDSHTGARTVVLDRTEIAELSAAELNEKLLQSCRYLHLDGRESPVSIYAARLAREAGAEVVLDAGSMRENIKELLPLVDHMVVSKSFAEQFTGEGEPGAACLKLLEIGFLTVTVTLGNKGCVCAMKGDFFQQDAFEVEVVDTTGSGDVFHGAYIYGLSKGWPMDQVIEFASAAAAIKCTRIGGRQGIPTVDEVVQFIEVRKGRL